MSAVTGPIPPYQNVPIHAEYYKPSRFVISAISLGLNTTVTTTANNDYVIGQLVRLIIPPQYGCRELNEVLGYVISIPNPNQVVININSIKSTPFLNANLPNQAQILAVGDINTGHINDDGNLRTHPHIPGSFRDISPR